MKHNKYFYDVEELSKIVNQLTDKEKLNILFEEFTRMCGEQEIISRMPEYYASELELGSIIYYDKQPYLLSKVNLDGTIDTMYLRVSIWKYFDETNDVKLSTQYPGPKLKVLECKKIEEAFIVEGRLGQSNQITTRILYSQDDVKNVDVEIIRVKKVPVVLCG